MAAPKRITIQCPLLMIDGSPLAPQTLSGAAQIPPHSELHMTLLHLGRLPELAAEVQDASAAEQATSEIEEALSRWVLRLSPIDPFNAEGCAVSLFGRSDNPVAALDVTPGSTIHAARHELFKSMCLELERMGISDVSTFVLQSKALGFTAARWRPHVTLGAPALPQELYPLELPRVLLHFGGSEVRNGDSLAVPGL